MTDINPLLDKVSKVAQRLNQSSDSLTETLNRVDKRLADDKIGLEFWLDESYDASALSIERYFHDETERRVAEYTFLGFTKFGNHWGLAVKTETASFDEDGDLNNWSTISTLPIAQASRALRIAALKKLPLFLEDYAKTIEQATHTIDGAAETLK